MNKAEQKALASINRISVSKPNPIRRFWICKCAYKTIACKPQVCPRCGTKMKPGRII